MRYGSIIVTLLAFALLGATEWQHAQARMNRVDVHVDRPGDYVFLLEEEIASDVNILLETHSDLPLPKLTLRC